MAKHDPQEDPRLLPIEMPEKRTLIHERLEGRQISRLQYMMTPLDEWAVGFEMTSGARTVIWSSRDHANQKYRYRLIIRYIPPQRIWTPKMTRHFGNERKNALIPEEPADDLQERVEGQYIEAVRPTYEASPMAGEILFLDFRGGDRLKLEALPGDPKKKLRADLSAEFIEKPKTHFTSGPLIVIP